MSFEKLDKAIGDYFNSQEKNVAHENIDLFLKDRIWQRVDNKSNITTLLLKIAVALMVGVFLSTIWLYQNKIEQNKNQITNLKGQLHNVNFYNTYLSDSVKALERKVALLEDREPVVKEVFITKYLEKAPVIIEKRADYGSMYQNSKEFLKELEPLNVVEIIEHSLCPKDNDEIRYTTSITDSIKSLINEGKYDTYTISYGEIDVTKGYSERPWKFIMKFD